MKKYLLTIILTSIAIGFYNILVPKHNGIEKFVKLISMLIILTAILSPVSKFLKGLNQENLDNIRDMLSIEKENNLEDYTQILQEYLNSYSLTAVENQIKEMLYNKYSIPRDECEVQIYTQEDGGNILISKIQILLLGESIFKNPYQIEKYLGETLNCKCQVLIKAREG